MMMWAAFVTLVCVCVCVYVCVRVCVCVCISYSVMEQCLLYDINYQFPLHVAAMYHIASYAEMSTIL